MSFVPYILHLNREHLSSFLALAYNVMTVQQNFDLFTLLSTNDITTLKFQKVLRAFTYTKFLYLDKH